MTHEQLKAGRFASALTQVQAADHLGVSQPYLSQLERGERPITAKLARSAATLYGLRATALPILESDEQRFPEDPEPLGRQLAGLGYPGFTHVRGRLQNPAFVLLEALLEEDLKARLTKALPWVVLTYPDMDWPWLVREAKLRDMQNRLGFVVAMARDLAATRPRFRPALERLSAVVEELEHARLAREDTLCRESMPDDERERLAATRSALARHWNLLTDLTEDQLPHVS